MLIAHSLRGEGFDASEDGTGRGTPIVPVSFTGGASECITLEDCAHPVTGRHGDPGMIAHARSEEHTSELQSLMRTSYAVFCLQKNKSCQQTITNENHAT